MEKASPQQERYVNNTEVFWFVSSSLHTLVKHVDTGQRAMGLIKKRKQESIQNSDKRLARENVACEKRFPLPLKVLYITCGIF